MAVQKVNIIIQPVGNGTRNMYNIWTDLPPERIKGIRGVTRAAVEPNSPGDILIVYLDPRYDAEEVLEEIKELASTKEREDLAKEFPHDAHEKRNDWNLSIRR